MNTTQQVSCLYSHESVQPLLVLQQLLLPTPSVDLLKPAKLLSSSLLPFLRAHTASRHLTREGKLHAVNLPLIKLRAAPLLQLCEEHERKKEVCMLPRCCPLAPLILCYLHPCQPQGENVENYMHACTDILTSTFLIIHSSVTVLMQQLLHTAECDGSKVTGVFQLEEALQVGRCLTPSHIHTLTVQRVQPWTKNRMEIRLYGMNCE